MTAISYEIPKPKIIEGLTGSWELVIGMEIHAQISSKSKLFSGASTTFGSEPNSNVSLIDAGMPGMLPVLNRFCVEQAVKTGLGLNAKINLTSKFDRKNYFYPDLPQGYQISQLYEPLVGEGKVRVDLKSGAGRTVRIERIHIEQDAGKSIHDMDPKSSLVDLNRTGIALMEIVSKPDIRGPEEASEYVRKIRQILRYLGTCDGNMQEGSLRADVNISVCRMGDYQKYEESDDLSYLSTRCEIKNMNSMRFIQQAIDSESRRQIAIIEDGGQVKQETRLYDPDKNETRSLRSKEEAHDYRYFPCPDLLPLRLDKLWVQSIADILPELPDMKKDRFISTYGITDYDASVLTAEVDSADFFEKVAKNRDGKISANWIINDLFGRLNKEGKLLENSPITTDQLGSIIDLIIEGKISSKIAKELFDIVWQSGGDPAEIVVSKGMLQVSDISSLKEIINRIIDQNPDQVSKLATNPKIMGWFVGQVMKETEGKANPKSVNELLKEKLKIN
ncbi:MAG: Asp-tRNA(Asn)/Glu-tRNA(Gln) amidotransferase subunit GatB [Paracoccaceae bacterium]|nr:Asp-tRNA(Asn)/Glu-tRNA(Gln) amidotransferase subunit GatB [Paracoccaceae bacterium]